MNRNVLFAVIGALVVAVGVLAYALNREQQKKSGVEISFGERGIAIESKK
jgi:hypothetical protein